MAHMQATGIETDLPRPTIEVPSEPIAEISATLLRAQAFLSGCGIALMVREGATLVCRASNGAAAPEIGARIPVEQTFLGLCVTLKKPQSCENADADLRVENATYGRLRPKSILAVPVRAGQDVIAVLAGFSSAPNAFSNTQVAILRTVADSLSRPVQQLPSAPPAMEMAAAEPAPIAPPQEPVESNTPKPAETYAPAAAAVPLAPLEELLTLADDPAPALPTPPAPLPRPSRARLMAYPVPPSLTLSPRRSRRLHPAVLKILAMAAVGVLGALATAAWFSTRMPTPPGPTARPAPPPIVQPSPRVEPIVSTPVPEVPAAPVAAAKPAVPAPKPHDVSPAVSAAPSVPIAEPMPPKLELPKPAQSAPAEAPVLALNTVPALPALVAPHVDAPKIHQSAVVPARLEYRVAPEYPMIAVKRRVGGEVVLSLVVRKDGSVSNVKVVSGNSLLTDSAISAVKHWRYSPATLDGKPVEASAQVVLKFDLPAR